MHVMPDYSTVEIQPCSRDRVGRRTTRLWVYERRNSRDALPLWRTLLCPKNSKSQIKAQPQARPRSCSEPKCKADFTSNTGSQTNSGTAIAHARYHSVETQSYFILSCKPPPTPWHLTKEKTLEKTLEHPSILKHPSPSTAHVYTHPPQSHPQFSPLSPSLSLPHQPYSPSTNSQHTRSYPSCPFPLRL